MYGWKNFLGHLCGGGTMANLEALWWRANGNRERKFSPANRLTIRTADQRRSAIAVRNGAVRCAGRMDVNALAKRVGRGDVGTVVATMGTTATGSVDPLPEILALRAKHGFRIHADAAYGGYFVLAENLEKKQSDLLRGWEKRTRL